jgi:2-hydroxymuconate-semialdehyde hydrolase
MDPAQLRQQMLAGLGARSYMLDVEGIRTSVIEIGDGDPLVLQHGAIECGGIIWAPVLAELARTHRVVVPDVPGLGESAPVARLDLDAYTRWFDALLDLIGLAQPTLVAHSLLGTMAARYAARRPQRLGRLVLCAAPGIGPYRMPGRLRYVAIRFALRPTAANAERFDRFALYDLDATRLRDPDWHDAFDAYNLLQARRHHVKRTMNRLVSDQTKAVPDAELARIAVPTSLLWGRHDRMVPLAIAQVAADRHRWPLQVIDDAGHAPQIETPDHLADVLGTLLGGPPPAPPIADQSTDRTA